MRVFVVLLFLSASLAACDSTDETFTYINVVSWNLHDGYDIATMAAATSDADLRVRTFDAYRSVLLTNFPNRARRIADAVERSRPDVITLQEVASFRTESPGDFATNPVVNASQVRLDFLPILLDSLAGRGLNYRVASVSPGPDFELPASAGASTSDIRFSEANVILVSSEIAVLDGEGRSFTGPSTFVAAGNSVQLARGYAFVRASKDGVPFSVYTTQFQDDGALDAAHRAQLIAEIVPTGNAILTGSLGASTWMPPSFTDAWAALRPAEEGATCCLSTMANDPVAVFSERSDKVLSRGGTVLEISRLGSELRDRLVSGLWPSDRTGLGARILFREE